MRRKVPQRAHRISPSLLVSAIPLPLLPPLPSPSRPPSPSLFPLSVLPLPRQGSTKSELAITMPGLTLDWVNERREAKGQTYIYNLTAMVMEDWLEYQAYSNSADAQVGGQLNSRPPKYQRWYSRNPQPTPTSPCP